MLGSEELMHEKRGRRGEERRGGDLGRRPGNRRPLSMPVLEGSTQNCRKK